MYGGVVDVGAVVVGVVRVVTTGIADVTAMVVVIRCSLFCQRLMRKTI